MNMKEYGGYIELDTYRGRMLHADAAALNCGRNCLAYLLEARKIKKILLPLLLCDSVTDLCRKYGTQMRFYQIDAHFHPQNVALQEEEWLYIVNYYGQLERQELAALKEQYQRVIIDNAQAYFDTPLPETDTIYTCRKFFGVPDGAFLYTDAEAPETYPTDESFERMHFLLGRFERPASQFYAEYTENNHMFASEPIKLMSKLTRNLLCGIDYDFVKQRRTENFRIYHLLLRSINGLALRETEGAFAYPLLLDNGAEIRKALQAQKIYIPTLWPNVMKAAAEDEREYLFAQNILPLPCDQRYNEADICLIAEAVKAAMQC